MIKYPRPLKKGDKIAIVSPAGHIYPEKVAGAVTVLTNEGWRPVVMPHALGVSGIYSGTADERYNDLESAFLDPEVRAIL
ncbi:MAG: LD-carboxypeptidase, partial [Muribaculaceae bacterium]|nr:LD-carboxypeptidase [Muribaculaceae bacterium]